MLVREMTLEGSEDSNYHGVYSEPSWFEIKDAICNMEEYHLTGIYLAVEEGELPYLLIAGGQSGKYIVELTSEDGDVYNLFDITQSDEKIALVASNQLGYYSAKICLNLETALKAAQTFAESGQLESSLNWEKWNNIRTIL
jgi:Immunity protein Imm1